MLKNRMTKKQEKTKWKWQCEKRLTKKKLKVKVKLKSKIKLKGDKIKWVEDKSKLKMELKWLTSSQSSGGNQGVIRTWNETKKKKD